MGGVEGVGRRGDKPGRGGEGGCKRERVLESGDKG